jgi:hypothetical protein
MPLQKSPLKAASDKKNKQSPEKKVFIMFVQQLLQSKELTITIFSPSPLMKRRRRTVANLPTSGRIQLLQISLPRYFAFSN